YRNDYKKEEALKQMEQYCSRLDPGNFSCHLSTFFNQKNHAKIIMTENIAYIGSQNFSDESRNNFESGIIIRDSDVIMQIREQMVKEILDASIPFSSSYYYLHQEELLYWLEECKR
ncbi:phospholipase D-like domain-containing protein, partial [Pseudomonas aeruginosa]